ncbi:MAG TPA: hypothetical protein VHO24_19640 [Opitutaceae bacterium]|nr:hypothetical protein [Opitutaceae bacterium]
MKNPSSFAPTLRCFSLLLLIASPLRSQQSVTGAISVPGTAVPTTPVTTTSRPIPEMPLAPTLIQTVKMNLKWNDAQAGFRIPVQNSSDEPLKIDAIQSSGDLFIVSFPGTIPPRGSDDVMAILDARPGTSSDTDVIRLKTSQGDKTILVEHVREKVVALDRQELVWAVGEQGAKSATLTIAGGVTKLTKVRALKGATATLTDAGAGKVLITVTPKSTDAPASFPVILDFDPALPGATPVITCTIGSKG